MFRDEIIERAKNEKIYLSFDMDGVLAEYNVSNGDEHRSHISNVYLSKRPIMSIIDWIKDIMQCANIEIGILSNCYFREHKKEKIEWLHNYLPELKQENIHIICYEDIEMEYVDKFSLKKDFLEREFAGKKYTVYHIDDDIRIIKRLKDSSIAHPVHISSLLV